MEFHERLAQLRKDNNLTQQELADKLNMSRGTYAQYEIGRREPDFDTLKRLAKLFNTTTDYLLGMSNNLNSAERASNQNNQMETQIAANMEAQYGEKPSPQLVELIREVIHEELDKKERK